ncbi:hypothetical protein Harman_30570 [Haloarcula mannanilytica]|uniref:Uncharacterized protein n=1 Tax=Haloarcula mannanilytica TaxID=2509225 RepID=A0A4C2ELF7_9EURY|nr:hypothetical protein Harman_30570 [Haloarcula mannanilytica]
MTGADESSELDDAWQRLGAPYRPLKQPSVQYSLPAALVRTVEVTGDAHIAVREGRKDETELETRADRLLHDES